MHLAILMLASGFAGWNIGYAIGWIFDRRHGSAICQREPLNTTQQIGEVL